MKAAFISADVLSGFLISLEQPLTTVDQNLSTVGGVYTADEWRQTRIKGYNKIGDDGSEISNNQKYLGRMFSTERRKLLAALSLAENFDFSRYSSILEIGCGEMIQAFVIKNSFPHIRYCATDLDSYIIEKCSQLSVLDSIEKGTFNILDGDSEKFEGADLVIGWGVEYAIDRKNLLEFFRSAGDHSVPVLLCTQQIIGIVRYASRFIRTRGFHANSLAKKGVRLHGWVRSFRFWRKIADHANMHMKIIRSPSTQIGGQANYFWLLFEP